MGNFFNKFRKINTYELNDTSRQNLLYDNISEELEYNKNQVEHLKNSIQSLETNHSSLLNQLNKEMIEIKNELSNIILNKNNYKESIKDLIDLNNNLDEEVKKLKNRIVILESNEQFHSITQ